MQQLKRSRQDIRTNVFTNGMERKLSDYNTFIIWHVCYHMMDQKFSPACHLAPQHRMNAQLLPLSLSFIECICLSGDGEKLTAQSTAE